MELKGSIEEIIYQNEANGYTICQMQTEEELITAVRIFALYQPRRYTKNRAEDLLFTKNMEGSLR